MFLSEEELKKQEKYFRNKFVSNCELCHGEGFSVTERNGYEVSTTCSCVKKTKKYVELLDWGVPKKYLINEDDISHFKTSSYGNDLKDYVKNFVEDSKNLFITGPNVETWKINSFLIKQISKIKNPDNPKNCFNVAYSLFSDIVKINFEQEKLSLLNSLLYKSDVLFIDNVGGEFGRNDNKFSQRFLENIIRKRDNDCKILVITSTLNKEGIHSLYGDEIFNFISSNKIIEVSKGDTKDFEF